jgi:hypothetical protein
MKLLKNIKVFWSLLGIFKSIKEGIFMENGDAKAGIKTTEFWGKIVAQVISLVGALKGWISPDLAILIVAIMEAFYAIARSIAKYRGKNLPQLPVK